MGQELKKVFRGRLIFCLILVSVAVNAYLLYMQRDKIKVLRVIDDFTTENGALVTPQSMAELKECWEGAGIEDVSWEEMEAGIDSAGVYNSSITGRKMADGYCSQMYLQGKASEYVHSEFNRLESRIREAAKQDLTFFAPYKMHIFDFLSMYLLFAVNLEGIISSIILTLYLANFEKSNHTVSIVYGTRKGKRVVKDKLLASVAASVICVCSIMGLTGIMAVCWLPVNTIGTASISNPLVNFLGMPLVTRESMNISTYVLITLGVCAALTVIYSLLSFAISFRTKNSYAAFCVLLILTGIMKLGFVMAPTSTFLYFLLQYNPLELSMKAGRWFLYNSNNFSPQGYVWQTLILWFGISLGGCLLGLHHIKKEAIQ